jgi:hypothetical protein
MPARSNEFQRLITIIEQFINPPDATVTESKELLDKIVNRMREVDIVIEGRIGSHSIIVGIECTGGDESRPATLEWVEQMWGKHQSLPTDKLILVSQSGFSKSASLKAEWLGIKTYTLAEAENVDWPSVVRKFESIRMVNFLMPFITAINVICIGDPDTVLDVEKLKLPDSKLFDPFGNELGSPWAVANRWIVDPNLINKLEEVAFTDATTILKFERKMKEGVYLIDGTGVKWEVDALQIEAKCRKEVSTISLKQTSYGDAAVAHGKGQSFGTPTQVIVVQQQNTDPSLVFTAKNIKRLA